MINMLCLLSYGLKKSLFVALFKKRVQMYNNLRDLGAESEIFFVILQQKLCFTAYALVFK